MPDFGDRILNLLRQSLNDSLKQKKNMESMVYKDEPIIRRASELSPRKKPETNSRSYDPEAHIQELLRKYADDRTTHLPRPLKEIRRLAQEPAAFYTSRQELFYRQAKMLETYEDSYLYRGTCIHYCPTYQSLTDDQLRGYFTWRTRFADDPNTPCPVDFYKLRIFELLHLIGASDAEDAYHKLLVQCDLLCALEPIHRKDTKRWLRDFILYYRLDIPLPDAAKRIEFDETLHVVLNRNDATPKAFFDALQQHSSYTFAKSPLMEARAEEVYQTVYRLYGQLTDYYEKHRSTGLPESLFGRRSASTYILFENAIFFDHMAHEDYEYSLSEYTSYQCRGRWWTMTSYQGELHINKQIGNLLKAVDRVMRDVLQVGDPLRDDGKTPKYVETMIRKILTPEKKKPKKQAVAETLVQEPPKPITFDLTGLDRIREASDRTMERLIVDSPEGITPEVEADDLMAVETAAEPTITDASMPSEPGSARTVPAASEQDSSLLTPDEKAFLRLLLTGGPYDQFLREKNLMLSVFLDAINDKLYDDFADTVLILEGDTPEVIEDYLEDLKGYIE